VYSELIEIWGRRVEKNTKMDLAVCLDCCVGFNVACVWRSIRTTHGDVLLGIYDSCISSFVVWIMDACGLEQSKKRNDQRENYHTDYKNICGGSSSGICSDRYTYVAHFFEDTLVVYIYIKAPENMA